jgi:thymidine kinase
MDYLTIVGEVQSGKTNELLKYTHNSILNNKTSVIFIIRNVTADLLQLKSRLII